MRDSLMYVRVVGSGSKLVLVAVVVAFLLATVSLFWSSPAWAHTRLDATEPAADATVTEPFDSVVLIFSQAVSNEFAEVHVIDPADNRLDEEPPLMDGERVEQPLADLEEVGEYTVEWRVVANDGHPLEGTFSFVYDGELPEAATAADEPDPDASEPDPPQSEPEELLEPTDPTDGHEDEDTTAHEDDAAADDTVQDEELAAPPAAADGGSGPGGASLPLGIAGLLVVLTAGAAVYAMRAIRSWPPASDPQLG